MKYLILSIILLFTACRPAQEGGIEKIILFVDDFGFRPIGNSPQDVRETGKKIEIVDDSTLQFLEQGLFALERQQPIGYISSPPFVGGIIWGSGREDKLIACGGEINWDGKSYQVDLDWIDDVFAAAGIEGRVGAWRVAD